MLRLTDGIELSPEPSEKLAIVGVSGSGKSFLAARMAEEWMIEGVKLCVLDPVGIWWGLRTGYDGDAEKGFPVRIFGGLRGDAQLPEPQLAAEQFVSAPSSDVYDLSAVTFETMHWWAAAFLSRIGEIGPTITRPFHIIVEEAPMLAPQVGSLSRFQKNCKAAMNQCARVYRNFGVGLTVISQRASATKMFSPNAAALSR